MKHGGQTLTEYLKSKMPLKRAELVILLEHLFACVRVLIKNNYVHQDIKADNIVVDTKGSVRLIDFGWLREHDWFYHPKLNGMMSKYNTYIPSCPEYRLVNTDPKTSASSIIEDELDFCEQIYGFKNVMFTHDPNSDYSLSLNEFVHDIAKLTRDQKFEFIREYNTASSADIYSCGMVLLLTSAMFCVPYQDDDETGRGLFIELLRGCLMPHPGHRFEIDDVFDMIGKIKATTRSASRSPVKSRRTPVKKI